MPSTRKQRTCRCEAYPFPHRLGSGKCRELYNLAPEPVSTVPYYLSRQAMTDAGHKESDFR